MKTYVKWTTDTQVLEEHYVVTVKNLPSVFNIAVPVANHEGAKHTMYDRFLGHQIDNSRERIVVICHFTYVECQLHATSLSERSLVSY
jgi:hypothetical protein